MSDWSAFLNDLTTAIYNIGSSMMIMLGFQKVNGGWKAPDFGEFIKRTVEIIITALVGVFIVKYILTKVI